MHILQLGIETLSSFWKKKFHKWAPLILSLRDFIFPVPIFAFYLVPLFDIW